MGADHIDLAPDTQGSNAVGCYIVVAKPYRQDRHVNNGVLASMTANLHWNSGTLGDWAALLAQIPRSTLLQSWPYAEARMKTGPERARFAVIESGGRTIGMVLLLERRVLGLLHTVQISRGPLWLPTASQAEIAAGFAALRRALPRRPGRRLSLMPELPYGDDSTDLLITAGFRRIDGIPAYRTLWWDLTQTSEARYRRLRRNWRGALDSALRGPLRILEDDITHPFLPSLLQRYEIDRSLREFAGPDGTFLIRLRNAAKGAVTLLRAQQDGQDVAAVLFYCHGNAATYQVGWSDGRGRAARATHRLLWEAGERLAGRGVVAIDLGGINPLSAAGVTFFKRGLGAEEVSLCGTWQ